MHEHMESMRGNPHFLRAAVIFASHHGAKCAGRQCCRCACRVCGACVRWQRVTNRGSRHCSHGRELPLQSPAAAPSQTVTTSIAALSCVFGAVVARPPTGRENAGGLVSLVLRIPPPAFARWGWFAENAGHAKAPLTLSGRRLCDIHTIRVPRHLGLLHWKNKKSKTRAWNSATSRPT